MTIAWNPTLVLRDEPTGPLDSATRVNVPEVLEKVSRVLGPVIARLPPASQAGHDWGVPEAPTRIMQTPILSVIAALARNRVIGVNNRLPWRLPEDLKHFKALTMGHHIIMGRKTYESIGKPLPGRTTVIVSRDAAYRMEGCLTATSIDAAIAACAGDPEIFFVGGAQMYAQVLPRADRLYLTEIQADYAGDAWFPAFDQGEWEEMARDQRVSPEGLGYDFVSYRRRR